MITKISALLGTFIITLAIAGNANAQKQERIVSFINHNIFTDESALFATKSDRTEGTANKRVTNASLKAAKANEKALRNFNRSYKDVQGVGWSVEKDATLAFFSKDNVKTMIVYNKRGRWHRTLKFYPADKTPKNIIETIDYAFPKYNLKQAIKVEEGSMEIYIVQLENKTTIRKVVVYNGEVNVLEEFNKSI